MICPLMEDTLYGSLPAPKKNFFKSELDQAFRFNDQFIENTEKGTC